jgi:hypothetical protein
MWTGSLELAPSRKKKKNWTNRLSGRRDRKSPSVFFSGNTGIWDAFDDAEVADGKAFVACLADLHVRAARQRRYNSCLRS